MSELPKGWALNVLGYIATEITKGTTPTTIGFDFVMQGIPFVKVENIINNKVSHKSIYQYISDTAHAVMSRSAFKVGDVLFSIAGTIGKTALISSDDIPCNTNQAIAIIRGTSEILEPAYLRYNLSYRANEIFMANARGGAMNNVSLGDLKNIIIAIPPQTEQTRIVEKLDEVLAQVDAIKTRLDSIPAILKRFRQSVLAAAVSGRLTAEWRIQNKVSFSTWVNQAIDTLCDKVVVGYVGSIKPHLTNESEIPLLSTTHVQQEGFVWKEKRFVTAEFSKSTTKSIVKPNDILVARHGDSGRCCLVPLDYPTYQTSNVVIIKTNHLSVPKYLVLAMNALKDIVKKEQVGGVLKVINTKSVAAHQIPSPGIEEQKEIVRLVDQYFAFADTIEAQVKKAQARVDNLTQSILAKAFRGELVPQNPSDEPAEKLLERIAQARKEAEALAKAAKKVARTK